MTEVLDTPDRVRSLVDYLWTYDAPVGLDTETIGCDPRKQSPVGRARIWCVTLYGDAFGGVFVPASQLPHLVAWLESDKPKVGTNLYGYDYHALRNHGIELRGIVGDTWVMSRLLNPASKLDEHGGHGLKPWGARIGVEMRTFADLATVVCARPGPIKEYKSVQTRKVDGVSKTTGGSYQAVTFGPKELDLPTLWEQHPSKRAEVVKYATLDAMVSLRVYDVLRKELEGRAW